MKDKIKKIVDICIMLAGKLVLDRYLEELSFKDENILTKKDKKNILEAEKGDIEKGLLRTLGIAKILKNELDKIGIENKIIKGYYEGNPKISYYWNKVSIEGVWYNIDLAYDLEYIRARVMPDFLLVEDEFLTFQKIKNNLEDKKLKEENSDRNISYDNDVQKLVCEIIENTNEMEEEDKKYIIGLEIRLKDKYHTKTNKKYLNKMPWYGIDEFLNKEKEELEKMPYASQELHTNSDFRLKRSVKR